MKLNLTCCLFVLENNINTDIRKNDILNLKVLVKKDTNSLFSCSFDGSKDMKDVLRNELNNIVGFNNISFEQVYTLSDKEYLFDGCDCIYVGIMNMENIGKLDNNYVLKNVHVKDNKSVFLDEEEYQYKTIKRKSGIFYEYVHDIKSSDDKTRKMLLEIIISYKYIRSRLDNTDIIFKFMPKYFALEDVRTLYELLMDTSVDKSNFRKRIMKYCKRSDKVIDNRGYRPTYLFTYDPLENDIWL